jgi:hypothetical protein
VSAALAIRNDHERSVTWTESAHALISSALESSALIARVTTPEENEAAVRAQQHLRAATNEIEKVRKVLKEPVLEFGRAIDAAAKQIVAPLAPEEMRIAELVGNFAQLQEAKRKAAEAARLLEQQRIERERAAELARVAREEAQHRSNLEAAEREALRKAAEAKNADEQAKAAELSRDLARQKELYDAQSFERMNAIQEKFNDQSSGVPIVAAPTRATGQVVRTEWEIQEIREWELAKARPDLVRRIEFDRIEIKRLLDAGVKLPGVVAKPVTKSSVRAGRVEIVNV